ncbi:MAG: hypothetical protein J6K25_01605 [Thermoguttaceae bacterium]|nr:hypothetical protein [Thermoguttaceae bacterium]
MSTLCAYENYLRDRYVLGQSVHYAAGSSSPKPKSYDREGNEYVWSDEAGDYVRQVGGPGGGRTIRLSEVEEAKIEQPQNEQVDADSNQHGSKKEATSQNNVDYSEFADAYKRYRAEDKKVASLKRKASKIQKTVYAPSSGATPEEIQSARESLAKIRGEISASEKVKESLSSGLNLFTLKHYVVFVDSGNSFVINPSLELLDVLKQRKRLQDRFKKARKNAKEAKKAGSKVDVDNFTSVADMLETEIGRVNEQLSQMFPNETVVSVVDEKPKSGPANKKQEPQEERAEENAYRNDDETDATEFKPGDLLFKRNLLDHKTGYGSYRSQPSEYGKADLDALFHALNANDLSYFEDINTTDFDNSKKFVVTTRLGDKKEFTARSLFEEIQEESADGDGGFNIYNNADTNNFIGRYKGSKGWPRRFQKIFSETNKEPKLNWQLQLAANTLEDTNYEFARGEFGGDYAPQYLNSVCSLVSDLGQSLPPINADPKTKAGFLNRYLCFLYGSALAAYASDEEGLHRKEADKLAWQFLKAGRGEVTSRLLKKLFNAAEKQGFTSPAIDSPIGVNSGVYYLGDLQKKENAPTAQKQEPKNAVVRDVKSASGHGVDANTDSFVEGMGIGGLGLPSSESTSPVVKDGSSNKDAAYFVRRDLEATPKAETEEMVEEVDEVSESPSSEAPQRGDDAALERKVKEALGKGEPLRKKATRLRSKAKDAALKGRKEEAAGLRKQADEIEAEARKYIDEATNAGVELKNRRAEASQETVYNPVENADAVSNPVADQDEVETVWIKKSREADEDVAPYVGEISKKLKQEAAYYAKQGDVKKTEAVLKALKTFSEKWGLEFNQRFADARLRIASRGGVSEENTSSKRDMPIDPGSQTTHPQDPRYYPIDEEQIRVANSITSHFAPPVGTETTRYRQQVDEAIEAGELRKREVDARYHADIDKSVKRYAKKLADWINKKWKIIGSYGSSYVVGSGNYSIRKHDKKHRRLDAHNKGYAEVKELFESISRIGTPNAQQPVPETKEPIKKPEVPSSSVPEQQPEPVAETAQEPSARPRPERWTPLKSKMDDDDKRVVENTRKRLNFGLGDFAWRIANAKEKKDWQKVKELTVLAAQRYLEQARRAYRSHGGAEALAAFDEALSGEGLAVGQVRDLVVDKFRQLALMNVADLHKYAGERLDEWETFSQGAELPATKDKIALNRLLDKPHYAPNAVPYTPPEKGKVYEVPIDSLNLDPSRFQFKLNTNAQGVTDDLKGAEFDPMQAGIIHVWRDPDDGKDYIVNGHHRFNLAKNSGYDGKVNVRYIDADIADDAKAFGAVANIADSKGTATDVAEFIRTRGSDDIRTPGGKKIATKNKLLADGRTLAKLDETIFRKLKNGSIDEKTAKVIASELPDDKDKQLRLFADIERLGLDASQAQDRAWAYASIQGEKQQGSLFGDDAPKEYDVDSRSKLIGEIKKALGGAKKAAQAGGSARNSEYWESQKLATNFDRDRAKQLSKSAGQTLDFFKGHIRLTGPMQNIIKEETDEYRKASKAGKGVEEVVRRAIERIKDVAQGGDGSVQRVEGLGLEYEDRLPSAKSEQAGQGVEANGGGEKQKTPRTPSQNVRNRTAGEVRENGRTDRLSDNGDGRNLASVITEEAKKSGIPKSRVREALDAPRQSKTSTPQEEEKPDWLVALESQEELKPVSRGKYNPNAKPYSWKAKFPETEDELREYWREHVDGGEDEEVSFGSDGERISVGEQSGDAPMTPDELRRFAQLRHGRELRKSLGLSEHFSEKELKELQEPSEKRGRGRPANTPSEATTRVAREAQKSEVSQKQVQERIAEALGAPSDTSKRKSSRRPKVFDPDSIKDDVQKAIQIRDADRSYLSAESMESMMSIAKDVSDKHGIGGLKEFMRRIDVVPTARTRPQLLKELGAHLGEVSSNRFRATTIRKM